MKVFINIWGSVHDLTVSQLHVFGYADKLGYLIINGNKVTFYFSSVTFFGENSLITQRDLCSTVIIAIQNSVRDYSRFLEQHVWNTYLVINTSRPFSLGELTWLKKLVLAPVRGCQVSSFVNDCLINVKNNILCREAGGGSRRAALTDSGKLTFRNLASTD